MTSQLRYLRPWLLLVWLLFAFLPPTGAVGANTSLGGEDDVVALDDDEALFVIGNTLFALYHELGHALIDLLNLPVLGKEENAVDGFAAVTMIPEEPDPVRDALIVAVGDGWRALSYAAADLVDRPYWGEHALDEQRHFAIVCLMVGSDQEGFYDYALEAGLPERRIESCAGDFRAMEEGWKRLLDPHRPRGITAGRGTSPSISLVFDDPLPEQETVYDLIREYGLLEDSILSFAGTVLLPSPITVRFTACNEANAYWSSSQRAVTICYELIEEFDAILMGAL